MGNSPEMKLSNYTRTRKNQVSFDLKNNWLVLNELPCPDESKTVELVFPAMDLAFYDVNKKSFVVEPGIFKLMAGSSSAAIKSEGEVSIK